VEMNDYSTIKNPKTIIEIEIGILWELENKVKELKQELKSEKITIQIQAKKLNSKKNNYENNNTVEAL